MFTRRVIMNLKPGSAAEAGRIITSAVIPLLRQQKGMRYDDTFIRPDLSEAVLNTYWDTQGYAEAYGRGAYPTAVKALEGVLAGKPQVETFDISSSTFHRITARQREASRDSIRGRGGWGAPPHVRLPQLMPENTAMVNYQICERRVGAVTILDLDGALRAGGNRLALRVTISRLSEEGRNQILLNLAGLSAIDAGGLGELLQSNAELNKSGGQLKLLHPARGLREMMSITKLLSAFDIYENESEAIAGFARPKLDLEGRLLSYEDVRYETHS